MRSLIQPLQTSFSMLRRLRQFRHRRIGAQTAPPADDYIDPAALSLLRVQLLAKRKSRAQLLLGVVEVGSETCSLGLGAAIASDR